ncbi:topoisomerase DNA-binding C4 zinc finger domain-containing protein [Enterococcus alishanensis]
MTCDCGKIISKNSTNDIWSCKKCSRIFRLSCGEPYLAQDQIEKSSENTICPKCGKPLIERQGRYGTFYGCSGFPQCKYTEKIDK